MTLRSKMVATISAFCLVLALLIIGVWAAQSVKVEMGGSLTFNANDVNVRIEGTVEGAETNPNLTTLNYSAETKPTEEELATWQNNSLTFGRTDESVNDIVITIKITNLSKENAVNISVRDTITASDNIVKTVKRDSDDYVLGKTYPLANSTTDSESSTTFTITFSVANKNQPVSGVQFGYTIDLSDESYEAPSPVTAQGPGTVDFVDNGDGTTTLTATPNEGAVFVGWKDGNGKYIDINTWDYDTNVTLLTLFGIQTNNEMYTKEFADYSFYNDSTMSTQMETAKNQVQFANNAETIFSEWEYQEMMRAIDVMEMGAFSYVVDNDGITYTAVFSNNDKKEVSEEGYTFNYYEDANIAFISSCSITSGEVTLPNTITSKEGSQVVGFKSIFKTQSMGAYDFTQEIFLQENQISKITVPDSFCDIERFAFCSMQNLESVEIPTNIKVLKTGTFMNCLGLKSIIIPNHIEVISRYCFSDCENLNEVNFESESSLNYIGESAFSNTRNLLSITIPYSVKFINYSVFFGLTNSYFENKNGWQICQVDAGGNLYGEWQSLSVEDLEDSAQMASYILGRYVLKNI